MTYPHFFRQLAAGFSTVEFVAVIVLFAIVAVTVVPRLQVLSEYEQRGVHDKLLVGLQYARKVAVANRRYVCVAVSPGTSGKLTLTMESNQPEVTTGACDANLNPPAPDRTNGCSANQLCVGDRVALSASVSTFQFTPLGRLSPASDLSFGITGETSIKIDGDTGYIR